MTDATVAAAPTRQKDATTYSWVVLIMLLGIYIFNFLDRQLMSILQEQIKEELSLTDGQIGLMTGLAFAVFYTVFGVVVGFLADRTSRRNILFFGCLLWSLFTSICGFAKTAPIMMAARMGVGVGEAAGAPPSYSIISDYFPARRRGMALAIFSLGVPFGMALGAAFGARISEAYGWRMAFIGIGAAGIVAAFLLLLVVREPKRGAMDVEIDTHMEEAPTQNLTHSGADESASFVKTIREFFANPVLLYTALGAGFCAFAGYAQLNWNVSFLIRVKEVPMSAIASYYALMLAVSMGLGNLLSGFLVDWLSNRSKAWYALVPAAALALCIPFHLLYVTAPTWQMAMVYLSVPTCLAIFYLAPAIAVVQNAAKAHQRTMAGALLLMILNIIGLGGGPTFMGFLSDFFGQTHGEAEGLKMAMLWLTPSFGLAVLFLLLEARALSRQEKAAA